MIEVEGLEELVSALKQLPEKLERQVLRRAIKTAALPMLARAKELCPVETGRLRDSLRLRMRANKKKGVAALIEIGPGAFKGDTYYGAMVELGHKTGRRPRSALEAFRQEFTGSRKQVAAHPFLRPAFDSMREQVAAAAIDGIGVGLEEAFKA